MIMDNLIENTPLGIIIVYSIFSFMFLCLFCVYLLLLIWELIDMKKLKRRYETVQINKKMYTEEIIVCRKECKDILIHGLISMLCGVLLGFPYAYLWYFQ